MQVLANCHTDVGIRKQVNEDSICLKIASTPIGTIAMAVLCDGMGGLSKGELASASVVRTFAIWFDKELPRLVRNFSIHEVRAKWDTLIKALNHEIREYGIEHGIHLGTTLTALLVVEEEEILIGHIGDSRVYEIKEDLTILTSDQTLVAREVRRGFMTEEEAKVDPRRNILLQCLGECKSVTPEFIVKKLEKNCTYMLCSDGFRHQITKEEIHKELEPSCLQSEEGILQKLVHLTQLCKERKEQDNISAIVIRT